ncbi:MAG: hypothetical protein IKQ06_04535 [Bacilli bacterium]|nr:hypothetical protein [Bacilli bacterium]
MKSTKFQEIMHEERMRVMIKFSKIFPTKEEREKIIEEMLEKDIDFLCYCANQTQYCINIHKYRLKNSKKD